MKRPHLSNVSFAAAVLCAIASLSCAPSPFKYEEDIHPTSNLKQCGLEAIMYAADHDDRYPLASEWVDDLAASMKKRGHFSVSTFHDESLRDPNAYGFAFRMQASGLNLHWLKSEQGYILLFQSTLTTKNAHSGLETLPRPGRYKGGVALFFADGHAKLIDAPSGDANSLRSILKADAESGPD